MDKIGIDIDGVCAKYHEYVLSKLNDHPAIQKEYSAGKVSASLQTLFFTWVSEETYANLEPFSEAAESLRDMAEFYEIFYVTSREPKYDQTTKEWLLKHGFPNHGNIIYAFDKGSACVANNISILVEDQIKYVLQAISCGVRVILFDRPHNKPNSNLFDNRILGNPLVERATCWTDVVFKTYFPANKEVKSAVVSVVAKFIE